MQNKNLALKDVLKRNKSYENYKDKFQQKLENSEKFDAVKNKKWYLSYCEMLRKYIVQSDENLPKVEEHKDENGNILSLSFLEKNEETFFRSLFKTNNISICYNDYWRAELSIDNYYESLSKEKRNDVIKKDIEHYFSAFKEMRSQFIQKLKSEIKDQNKISEIEIYNVINKTSVFRNHIREDVEDEFNHEKPEDLIGYGLEHYKQYRLEDIIFADDFFDMTSDEIEEITDKNFSDWDAQKYLGNGLGTYEYNFEVLSNKIEKHCMYGIKNNPDMVIKFYYDILSPSIVKGTYARWFKLKFGLAYNYLTNSVHENQDALSNIPERAYKILIDNEIPKRIENILDTFDNLYGGKVNENMIQEIKKDCEYMIEFMQEQNIIERNDNLKIKDEDLVINFWDEICEFVYVVVCAFSKLFSSDYKIRSMAELRKLKTWLKDTVAQQFRCADEIGASDSYNSNLSINAHEFQEKENKISVLGVLSNIKQISKNIPDLKNKQENQNEIK